MTLQSEETKRVLSTLNAAEFKALYEILKDKVDYEDAILSQEAVGYQSILMNGISVLLDGWCEEEEEDLLDARKRILCKVVQSIASLLTQDAPDSSAFKKLAASLLRRRMAWVHKPIPETQVVAQIIKHEYLL